MLILTTINFLIITSIFGYSYIFKRLLFTNKNIIITNLDFLYGLFLLYFISLIFHIFIPLEKISNFVIFFGLLIFVLIFLKKKINISFFKYFFVVFLFSLIAYYGKDNVDSPLYHLQVVKWLTEFKLTFGLANLGVRLGLNYPWYSILGILNFEYSFFSNKYYLNLIIFSFLFYELIDQKKYNYAKVFLSLSFCYLLLFSLIHPYNFGVILNHFGNPEKDLINMCLFILSVYVFLKINEEENNQNYPQIKKNLISIFLICITFLLMQMPIYGLISILLIFIYYKFFKIRDHILLVMIIIAVSILWILKSVALNGCLIYPISITCLDTNWTINLETLNNYYNETKRYSRSLPSLEFVNDYYKTIETFLWLKPWFKNYYLTTALHQINSLILIFSFLMIFYFIKIKNFSIYNYEKLIIFIIFVVNLTCIIMIPEIRYYWGPHITLSSILLAIIIRAIDLRFLDKKNIFLYCPVFLLCLFIFIKVLPMMTFGDLYKLPIRSHDYSGKTKIGNYNGYDIYTNKWICADIKEICVNIPKEKYNLRNIKSYLFVYK